MKTLLVFVVLLGVLNTAHGSSSEDKGLAIAIEADRRDSGFGDWSALLSMTLIAHNGQSVTREINQKTLEVTDDGDKSIMVFDEPADLKGTAILTFGHKNESDDQWLFLPALKRVKRISSTNKSGPFMGSEFAYEDLSSQEIEKYTYNYLRVEKLDGEECYVVEKFPKDKKSGYTKQITWLDTNEYRHRKTDYFDRKGELMKTLRLTGYVQYLDQFWRPSKMEMVNHQTGKSTILKFTKYQFANGYSEKDFNLNSLEKIR